MQQRSAMKRVQKENGVETLYNCWDEKELLVSIKRSAGNAALDLGHVLSLFLTDAYPWLEGRTQRKFLEIPPYLGDPQEVSVNRTLKTAPSFTTGPQLNTNNVQLLPLEIFRVLKICR